MINNDVEREHQLIVEHTPLVVYLAKSFRSNIDLDELIQIGRIGLLEAIRNYDTSKNTKLSTFAYPYIKYKILRYIDKEYKWHKNHSSLTFSNKYYEPNNEIFDITPILTDKESKTIELRLAGNTFKEIATQLGCTKGWAYQIYSSAMHKIREANA